MRFWICNCDDKLYVLHSTCEYCGAKREDKDTSLSDIKAWDRRNACKTNQLLPYRKGIVGDFKFSKEDEFIKNDLLFYSLIADTKLKLFQVNIRDALGLKDYQTLNESNVYICIMSIYYVIFSICELQISGKTIKIVKLTSKVDLLENLIRKVISYCQIFGFLEVKLEKKITEDEQKVLLNLGFKFASGFLYILKVPNLIPTVTIKPHMISKFGNWLCCQVNTASTDVCPVCNAKCPVKQNKEDFSFYEEQEEPIRTEKNVKAAPFISTEPDVTEIKVRKYAARFAKFVKKDKSGFSKISFDEVEDLYNTIRKEPILINNLDRYVYTREISSTLGQAYFNKSFLDENKPITLSSDAFCDYLIQVFKFDKNWRDVKLTIKPYFYVKSMPKITFMQEFRIANTSGAGRDCSFRSMLSSFFNLKALNNINFNLLRRYFNFPLSVDIEDDFLVYFAYKLNLSLFLISNQYIGQALYFFNTPNTVFVLHSLDHYSRIINLGDNAATLLMNVLRVFSKYYISSIFYKKMKSNLQNQIKNFNFGSLKEPCFSDFQTNYEIRSAQEISIKTLCLIEDFDKSTLKPSDLQETQFTSEDKSSITTARTMKNKENLNNSIIEHVRQLNLTKDIYIQQNFNDLFEIPRNNSVRSKPIHSLALEIVYTDIAEVKKMEPKKNYPHAKQPLNSLPNIFPIGNVIKSINVNSEAQSITMSDLICSMSIYSLLSFKNYVEYKDKSKLRMKIMKKNPLKIKGFEFEKTKLVLSEKKLARKKIIEMLRFFRVNIDEERKYESDQINQFVTQTPTLTPNLSDLVVETTLPIPDYSVPQQNPILIPVFSETLSRNTQNMFSKGNCWRFKFNDMELLTLKLKKYSSKVIQFTSFENLSKEYQVNIIVFSKDNTRTYQNIDFRGTMVFLQENETILLSKAFMYAPIIDVLMILEAPPYTPIYIDKSNESLFIIDLFCNIRLIHLNHFSGAFMGFMVECLYKLRHDLAVEVVCFSQNIPFQREKRIGELFKLTNVHYNNKTPDIVLITEFNIVIFEITVSASENESRRKKILKYDPLVTLLRQETRKNVIYHVISTNSEFSSLVPQLQKIADRNGLVEYCGIASALVFKLMSILRIFSPFAITNLKKANKEQNTGRMDYINNLNFEPSSDVLEFESMVKKACNTKLDYNNILQELFAEKGKFKKDFPEHFSKLVPTHCEMKSIIDLAKELPRTYEENYAQLEFPAPTLHFCYDVESFIYPTTPDTKISEEDLVLSFLGKIRAACVSSDEPRFAFLKDLADASESVQNDPEVLRVFKTGYPNDAAWLVCDEFKKDKEKNMIERRIERNNLTKETTSSYRVLSLEERAARETLQKETSRQKQNANIKIKTQAFEFSRAKYLKTLLKLDQSNLCVHKKCLQLTKRTIKTQYFIDEAKIGYKKKLRGEKELTKKSKSLVPDLTFHKETETFLLENSVACENRIPAPAFLFNSLDCPDHPLIMSLKARIHDESTPLLDLLLGTKISQYSYRAHLFAQQLIHFGSMNNRKGHFYLCNTGIENVLCIVAGTKHKPSTDPGVPFMFVGAMNNNKISPLFGDVKIIENNFFDGQKYVFATNWRRLKLEKLTHMRDSFFSTLATGFKNLSEIKNITQDDLVENYIFRSLASLSVSQKVAEFLADFKYISMSTLSQFSKTDALIVDKIKGPFTKHIEIFILFQLLISSLLTLMSLKKNPIVINAYFEDMEELSTIDETVGGKIILPYLWTRHGYHRTFNNFLDSVHTYVHTIKEPASNFHENVKSLKTIIKFNEKFKLMTADERFGVHNNESAKKLLNKDMGFSAVFLNDATKFFFQNNNFNFDDLLCNSVFFTPISHFASTKASIPDPNRPIDDSTRMKVIDCMLLNEINKNRNFSVNDTLIEHTIKVLNSKITPIADMCIKVQYGPKREFYVLDMYFKFAIKFIEEFFKQLCKGIVSECISVPGDLKLLSIQEVNRKIRQTSHKNHLNQYYINGDCSKWSASELMESFGVLIYSMKNLLPEKIYYIFLQIIQLWKTKRLQIDKRISGSLIKGPRTEEMFDGNAIKQLTLPQNFLMGLFNYLSSFKAVIVFEYCKHLLVNEIPYISFKHLEHSDDYSIALALKGKEIVGVKTFITVCMRLGSITDSEKKTVISNWYQEFVSLFTFNGVMTYPQIKKVKEVTSAITGMSYYQDAATIGSRTGELIRVGCTNQAALIFLKIHNWLLLELYSLLPNRINGIYYNQRINPFTVPTQAFGISENWPLLYLLSDGDPNNYRLASYTSNHNLLFELSNKSQDSFANSIEGYLSLYNPDFLKKFETKRLNKVKKIIGYDEKEAEKFWQDHLSYKFLKPNYPDYQTTYLKSFFFLRSFTLAYARQSKLATILRISSFVRKKIITYKDEPDFYSIKEMLCKFCTIHQEINLFEDRTLDPRFLTEGSLAPILFDQILSQSLFSINEKMRVDPKSFASKLPKPYTQSSIDTNPAELIQYVYNQLDYKLDKRKPNPTSDIEKDAEEIRRMQRNLSHLIPTEQINFIYNCLVKDRKKVRVCISPTNQQTDFISFITQNFSHSFTNNRSCKLKIVNEIKFDGPLGSTPMRFHLQGQTITRFHAICKTLLSLALYIQLKTKQNMDAKDLILQIFERLELRDTKETLYTFLRNVKLSQIEVNNLSNQETQSLLVLQVLLCNSFQNFDDYSRKYSNILYKYDLAATYHEGSYKGNCIVSYSCFDSNCQMVYNEETKTCFLMTNVKHVAKALMLFNIGLHFVNRKKMNTWDSEKIIETLSENVVSPQKFKNILANFLGVEIFVKARAQQWSILKKDKDGLYYTNFGTSTFSPSPSTILPILHNPFLLSGSLDEARQSITENNFKINRKNWTIKTYTGEWTIAKFGISDLYTNAELFTNALNTNFQGVNLKFLLEDSRIKQIYVMNTIDIIKANDVLNAINFESIPDVHMKDVSYLLPLSKKIDNFKFHFPQLSERIKEQEFPTMKEISADSMKLVHENLKFNPVFDGFTLPEGFTPMEPEIDFEEDEDALEQEVTITAEDNSGKEENKETQTEEKEGEKEEDEVYTSINIHTKEAYNEAYEALRIQYLETFPTYKTQQKLTKLRSSLQNKKQDMKDYEDNMKKIEEEEYVDDETTERNKRKINRIKSETQKLRKKIEDIELEVTNLEADDEDARVSEGKIKIKNMKKSTSQLQTLKKNLMNKQTALSNETDEDLINSYTRQIKTINNELIKEQTKLNDNTEAFNKLNVPYLYYTLKEELENLPDSKEKEIVNSRLTDSVRINELCEKIEENIKQHITNLTPIMDDTKLSKYIITDKRKSLYTNEEQDEIEIKELEKSCDNLVRLLNNLDLFATIHKSTRLFSAIPSEMLEQYVRTLLNSKLERYETQLKYCEEILNVLPVGTNLQAEMFLKKRINLQEHLESEEEVKKMTDLQLAIYLENVFEINDLDFNLKFQDNKVDIKEIHKKMKLKADMAEMQFNLRVVLRQIEDIENSLEPFLPEHETDPDTLKLIKLTNIQRLKTNEAKKTNIAELLERVDRLVEKTNKYRTILNPDIDDSKKYLNLEIDEYFLTTSDKLAIKSDLTKMKLTSATVSIENITIESAFKRFSGRINNETNAWEDVSKSLGRALLFGNPNIKVITMLYIYITLNSQEKIRNLDKKSKFLWNLLGEVLSGAKTIPHREILSENVALAINELDNKTLYYRYRLADLFAKVPRSTDLGLNSELKVVVGREITGSGLFEDDFELGITSSNQNQIAESIHLSIDNPISVIMYNLLR